MKQTLIGIAGILIFSGAVFAQPASALTIDEIQVQIKTLLAKVADLQMQLKGIGGGTQPVDPTVTQTMPPNKHRICSILARNLSQGTQGNDVHALQDFLYETGYMTNAKATGYFGPMTAQAVAKWQSSEGVSAVGNFGPMSRERIKIWCGGGNNERFSVTPQRGTMPLPVVFKTNVTLTNSTMVADAGDYKIVFGDGEEEKLLCTNSTGTCQGPHRIEHTYRTGGSYTATLVHYGYFGLAASDGSAPSTVVGKIQIQVGQVGCTMEYNPVCGNTGIVCITTPCPSQKTYGNRCAMNADGASFLHEGQCRDSSSNKPPVISGFSGPTTLNVNQTGTWTINASDPENGQLSYFVGWADERLTTPASLAEGHGGMFYQNTTFTHSYSSAGTYTITAIVKDNGGLDARTTMTVHVGNGPVACTMEYAPICGQPPEPVCRHSIPACMMATPGPQTYSNRCGMNAAGATFLYSGECTTQPVACTADAMQCPNGSYVGRTGPNCQFACLGN